MANNITMSVHHPALSRRTSESAYSVLVDALPAGSWCYTTEGPRKGMRVCDLCLLLDGHSTPETTRDIALKRPFFVLTDETVLRATLQVITLDDNTRESDLALTWADLVHEHRRFLVIGYRYDPSESIMSEARRGNTSLRVLALELLRALTSRRYSNTHLIDSYKPPNTRGNSIYIAVRKALTHAANATWRTATQLD